MRNITAALASLTSLWTQIADISGVPGVSIGVFYEGDVIFRNSIGYRDLEQKLPATSDTVYPIGSLSKAFTSSIYGNLVEQGVVDWNSPIRDILPEFHGRSPEVEHLTNAIDLLSHRTGIIGGDSFYFHAQPLLNDTSLAAVYAGLPPIQPFRSTIQYNNLGYSLVSQVMSRVTEKSYSDLERYINRPLGLERTGVEFDRREPSDTAKKYVVADDGSVIENARPLYYDGTHMIASGGICSSVNDILTFNRQLLNGAMQQMTGTTGAETHRSSPLKELPVILTGHTFFPSQRKSLRERTYGLGWIRTQLPGELGAIGLNSWLVEHMPIIGRNSTPQLTIYHQGNVPGATSALYLFPDTSSGVVVLANGYGLSDVPDWIAQSIIETLFDEETDTPYLQLAEEAVSAFREWSAKTVRDLEALKNRKPASAPVSLEVFVGEYWNTAGTFKLVVNANKGDLKLQFQGLGEEEFDLKPFHDDVFSWFTSSRDLTERGRHVFGASHYLIDFQRESLTGKVTGLRWAHDEGGEPGELFERTAKVTLPAGFMATLLANSNIKILAMSAFVIVFSELVVSLRAICSQATTRLSRSV